MIGIFDSGFGGLTTVRELRRILPQYDILFLGDSARTPYGSRSTSAVTRFTEEGVQRLFAEGAKIVLVACNTASADALRYLQSKYPHQKTLGVLIPAAEEALAQTRFGRIGVLATRGVVASKNYEKELNKLTSLLYHPADTRAEQIPKITSAPAPLLVPLVEEGWIKKPETRMILRKYLRPLKEANIDTLILGCTHYPLLLQEFQRKMGKQCVIINSGVAQARNFVNYLSRHREIEQTLSQNGVCRFLTTDDATRFRELGSRFLGETISSKQISHIELLPVFPQK
ncbi:glutamate racemase [Candidatus Peregrinibacteria bacterium]|nr:MAG: glutamate racemase [Candidatus Peregrinibacteria bacterium]